MRLLVSSLLVLLSAGICWGDNVTLAVDNPNKADGFIEISVPVSAGDMVGFVVFPTPTKTKQYGNVIVINGPTGTKYQVAATVVNFGKDPGTKQRYDQGTAEITVGPASDGPAPDVNGGKDDDFTKSLKAAWKTENAAEKMGLTNLIAVYKGASKTADTAATWKALFDAMEQDAADKKVGGTLLETQKVLQAKLATVCPTKNRNMDDADRNNAKAVFATIITALGKLK